MVEAISLQETLPEPHGRFVKPIQLAGFEALTGIPIAPPAATSRARPRSADDRTEQRAREKAEAERREQEKAVKKAEARVERAAAEEQRARAEWERARRALDEAKRALEQLATGS
jgi:type IV secretory pathway VirB10-like protein